MQGTWYSYIQYLIGKADSSLAKVKDNSVFAQIMSSTGDASTFDKTQHSLLWATSRRW